MSVSLCSLYSGCVCLSAALSSPGFVLLHVSLSCVSVSPSLYISLSPCVYLYKRLALSLSLFFPFSLFSSPIPILWLTAPVRRQQCTRDSLETPQDTAQGLPPWSPPHARHLSVASIFLLQLWDVERTPGRETVPSICSGALDPLTLSATIKGAGSRGSKMIMIASVRQKRSRELRGERESE